MRVTFVMNTGLHQTFVSVILVGQKGIQVPPRTLKLRLKQLIDKRFEDLPADKIAENLGLAAAVTSNKYLRNEAKVLDVRVLEKACDWLNVGIEDLFELVPCDFFPHDDKPLLRLCSKEDGGDDFRSLGSLHDLFDPVPIEKALVEDQIELADRVCERDCVIVGSPHNNSAGEIALCSLFNAISGNTSDENRRKLPLLIEAPMEWQQPNALVTNTAESGRVPLRCHVMAPNSGEKSSNRAFAEKSARATADFYPHKEFQTAEFGKAKDFGIIFVADHWVDSDRKVSVRTYWLSGFSSAGTEAALYVVQNDVRRFSLDTPKDKPGEFILSFVQATSRKKRGALNRLLNDDYDVVHTIRGSLPHEVRSSMQKAGNESTAVRDENLPQRRGVSSSGSSAQQPARRKM